MRPTWASLVLCGARRPGVCWPAAGVEVGMSGGARKMRRIWSMPSGIRSSLLRGTLRRSRACSGSLRENICSALGECSISRRWERAELTSSSFAPAPTCRPAFTLLGDVQSRDRTSRPGMVYLGPPYRALPSSLTCSSRSQSSAALKSTATLSPPSLSPLASNSFRAQMRRLFGCLMRRRCS